MSIKLTGDLESVAEDKVVTKSQYVSGGYMVLDTESERDNLTDAVAPVGTLVYVAGTKKIYQKTDLRSGNKSNGTWAEYSVDQDEINSNALDYIEKNYQYELSDSDKSYINNYIDENMPSGGGSEGGVLNGYNYNSEFEKHSCARDEIEFENDGIKKTIFATYEQKSINEPIFTPTNSSSLSDRENFIIDESSFLSFSYYNDEESTIVCPLIPDNDGQVINYLGYIVSNAAIEIFLGPVTFIGSIACPLLENLYFCRGYAVEISESANPLVFNQPVNIYVPRKSLYIPNPKNVKFNGNCMFHFEEGENELQDYIDAGCFDNCFTEYGASFPRDCSSYSIISRKEISIIVSSKVNFQNGDCMFNFSKEPRETSINEEDNIYTAAIFTNDEEPISLSATYSAEKFLPAYTANYTIGDKEKTIDDKIKDVNNKVIEAEKDIDAISDNIAKVTDNEVILQKNLINLIHPVGSVILTRDKDFDPTQVYRYTEWIQWVDGYLKVGTTEEFNEETKNEAGEHEAIGSYKIETDMLPPHDHSMYHNHTGKTKFDGRHYHQIKWDIDGDGSGPQDLIRAEQNETKWGYMNTEDGGKHFHELMIDTYSGQTGLGLGQKNDYKPKFYPVYAWERIK